MSKASLLWQVGLIANVKLHFFYFGSKNENQKGTEFYWAHLCVCTVGSYASLSVCLDGCLDGWMDVCDVTKIHIWGTAWHMFLKFGQDMHMDDLEVDPEGQGHRSKVKVIRSKNVISGPILQSYREWSWGEGDTGLGQRSHGSRSAYGLLLRVCLYVLWPKFW